MVKLKIWSAVETTYWTAGSWCAVKFFFKDKNGTLWKTFFTKIVSYKMQGACKIFLHFWGHGHMLSWTVKPLTHIGSVENILRLHWEQWSSKIVYIKILIYGMVDEDLSLKSRLTYLISYAVLKLSLSRGNNTLRLMLSWCACTSVENFNDTYFYEEILLGGFRYLSLFRVFMGVQTFLFPETS